MTEKQPKENLPHMDLSEIHNNILPIIEEAEKILCEASGKTQVFTIKEGLASQSDFTTQADKDTDNLFRQKLAEKFPDIGFITEESEPGELKEYNWVIDPIDGTGNFSHGFDTFGISIALYHGNEPVYGCISLPKFNKRLHAIKDGGIQINGEKVDLQARIIHAKPIILCAPSAHPEDHGKLITTIGKTICAPRDLGCCVYQAFETIAGKADLNIAYKLSLWDIGAAVILAKEAGLAVEYISPKPDLSTGHPQEYAQTVVIGLPNLVEKVSGPLRELI